MAHFLDTSKTMAVKSKPFVVGDVVRVSSAAPADYKGRTGIVTEVGPNDDEYRVEFSVRRPRSHH